MTAGQRRGVCWAASGAVLLSATALLLEPPARAEGPPPLLRRAAPAGNEPLERFDAAIDAWDLDAAQKVLDALGPEDQGPMLSALRGKLLFERGDYPAAVQAYARAAKGVEVRPGSRLDEEIRLARAVDEEVRGDDVHESAHFVLRTRPGKDALLVPYALSTLEQAYAQLTQDLGVHPPGKIRVEVYESAQALARVSPLTVAEIKSSGTIALCSYNRLMITTPRALVRGYPWEDTLTHEFVHYLVTQRGHNRVPIWLQEGLAKFLETRWRGPPGRSVDDESLRLLARAARKGELIPFAAMHPSIAKMPTQEKAALAFAEVESAIRLLYERGGQRALTGLVAAMADGASDQEAVARASGQGFAAFEGEWRAAAAKADAAPARSRSTPPSRPTRRQTLVFQEDARRKGSARGRDPSGPDAGDAAPVALPADAEARRSLRLGELMLARRRFAAAEVEYGRARARLPAESPIVARRYAFAALQAGHAGEAEAALRAGLDRDPQDEAAQALYAQVLVRRKAWTEARAALDAGMAMDPFDPQLHATYVQVAQGLRDPALEKQERAALALASGSAGPARPAPAAGSAPGTADAAHAAPTVR